MGLGRQNQALDGLWHHRRLSVKSDFTHQIPDTEARRLSEQRKSRKEESDCVHLKDKWEERPRNPVMQADGRVAGGSSVDISSPGTHRVHLQDVLATVLGVGRDGHPRGPQRFLELTARPGSHTELHRLGVGL